MRTFILLLMLSLTVTFCTQQINEPVQVNDTQGQLSLTLSMAEAPSEVAGISGTLIKDQDTVKFDFEIKDGYAKATVEDLEPGEWYLQVDAYNGDSKVIYSGSTSVTVEPGVVTPVNLNLDPTTGSLEIIVTWGDITHRIIAYFPFENSLSDKSVYHNNGTTDASIKFTDGVFGKAIEFDGEEDYVLIPHIDAYNKDEKTISFWFYKDNDYIRDTPGWDDVEGLVFKAPNTSLYRDFSFLIGNQSPPFNLVFNVYDSSDSLTFLKEYEIIQPRTWYNVTGVISKNKALLYLNGELIKEAEYEGVLYHNTEPIIVGATPPINKFPSRFFKGKIDELVIFGYALSAKEVVDLYRNGVKTN